MKTTKHILQTRMPLIIFVLISTLGFGQEIKYLSENYDFTNGEMAYVFGNDVKLRDEPNTGSEVLRLLSIGEEIQIVEKSDSEMEFNGMQSPWYKVKTKDKVGYVLGGLISLDKATHGNLTYLISLKRDGVKLFLITRVLENESDFKENTSQLLTGDFSIKAKGNRGLESIKSIFEIDYLAEACGVNGGGIYLFYDGSDLIKAIDYTQVADADLYWFSEEYIFPDDKDGIKNKILYKREVGETKDYETQWIETKLTQRVLAWNGTEISPKLETEKEE